MSIEISGDNDRIFSRNPMNYETPLVQINAHTPLDDPDKLQTKFTQADFQKNLQSYSARTSIDEIREMDALKLDEALIVDIGIKKMEEFPPKGEVEAFQASHLLDGSGVVFDAMKNGYAADKAIVFGKAQKAYAYANANEFANSVNNMIQNYKH